MHSRSGLRYRARMRWASAGRLIGVHFAHQVEDRAVEHEEAGAQGGVAQGLSEKTFADAGRTEQKDIAALADELAGGQVENLTVFDGGIEIPVKVLQRFEVAEAGGFFAAFQPPLRAHVQFVLQ